MQALSRIATWLIDELVDVPACLSERLVLAFVPFTPGVFEHVALAEAAKLFRRQRCADGSDALKAALVVVRMINVVEHKKKEAEASMP